jgi:4-diphosphocytidyl-2C-methyl-D-erythritol kinase
MTGSGACVIGIFDSETEAADCYNSLLSAGLNVFMAETYNGTII